MYKAYFKKIPGVVLKSLFWVAASLIGLIVLVWILIRLQFVQDYARDKTVAYLQQKLGTKVAIGAIRIDFPNSILLERVLFEDQHKDTLLFGDRLSVDISMLGLLNNKVLVSNLELDNIHTYIHRNRPDSFFNYQYIINAFDNGQGNNKPKDSLAPMFFKFGLVQLKKIDVRFTDQVKGIDSRISIGLLKTNIKKVLPEKAIYESGPIQLEQLGFHFADTIAYMLTRAQIKKMSLNIGELDLNHLLIPVHQFQADSANVFVKLGKTSKQGPNAPSDSSSDINAYWRVLANNIGITHSTIQFDADEYPVQKNGLDYFHVKLHELNLKADSLDLSPNMYAGKIQGLNFKEQSGLTLQELSTEFLYTNQKTSIKQFVLKTPKTNIQSDLLLQYKSTESLAKDLGSCQLDLALKESKLAISDLILVAPMLEKQLRKQSSIVLQTTASVKGKLSDLVIGNFSASGYGKTSIKFNGRVKGLPNLNKSYFQFPFIAMSSSRKDILQILPAKTVPNNIQIPENIKIAGSFNGSLQAFTTKLAVKTSFGNAAINGQVSVKRESYDAIFSLDQFELGKLLKKDSLIGKMTMMAVANGNGFDPYQLQAKVQANVQSLEVKGYEYHHFNFNANAEQGNYQVVADILDPNLQIKLNGNTTIKKGFPNLKLDVLIDTINFKALHFTTDSFALHARLKVDFSNTNPDSLNGEAFLSQIKFSRGWHHFSTDTARIKAGMEGDENHLLLFSKPLIANLKGKYKLTELPIALGHYFNRYYQIPGFKDSAFVAQDWNASFQFRTSPIVLQFLPELKGTDTMGAAMHFVSERNLLDFHLDAPLIQYDGNKISKLQASLSTNDAAIKYQIGFEQAALKSLLLNNAIFNGKIADNTVYGNLVFKNKLAENLYQLSLSMKQKDKAVLFHLNPDSLLLNKQAWQVDPLNHIRYDSTGIQVRQLKLSYQDQYIDVNSNNSKEAISLAFNNFSIRTITDIIRQDSISVEGIINGQALLKNLNSNPVFTSDISIAGLAYDKRVIGDLQLKVDNETANKYKANMELIGMGTHANMNGYYDSQDGLIDLQLLMDSLNMNHLVSFSAGHIKDAGGKMQANIHLTGNTKKPSLNGTLQFEQAFIAPTMLGQKFVLENEQLKVNDNGLHFDHLTLTDSTGKKAILDGNITTTDLRNFGLDLSLDAKDFNLINSTQADNQLFFGKLNMDANIALKGSLENPELNATLRANKQTDLTVVLPSSDPELQSREGVVNFIDSKKLSDSSIQINVSDTLAQRLALMKGLNLSAIIETDTSANFTLIIDSRTGDALSVRGKSSLSAGMDESGKLSLTGLYEVQKGSYQISFNLLKKKFELVKGSTITWTGDPMSAIVDIKAMYATKASPIDLVESELGGLTNTELNKYKQRLPVEVYLKMKGDLLKPQISFDVIIPEPEASKWPVVEDKLTQLRLDESEINKQVFALLILGRFIGEDITQNNTGTTTTGTMMRQSVSGILTDQLNKVASGLIKGVDINVGLESQDDYSSGTVQTRTDLRVGVSRSLNNDRIKVNVGTNVPIEGGGSGSTASMIAGDVTVDYLLSKDGRYMLRTYSKNSYEGVIEGQIIETGLTFVITLEYDHWREIFKKKAASEKAATKKQKSNSKPVSKQ